MLFGTFSWSSTVTLLVVVVGGTGVVAVAIAMSFSFCVRSLIRWSSIGITSRRAIFLQAFAPFMTPLLYVGCCKLLDVEASMDFGCKMCSFPLCRMVMVLLR